MTEAILDAADMNERYHWLQSVEQALIADPRAVSLVYERAQALNDLNDPKAETAFLNLLALEPDNFQGLVDLGRLYLRQGRFAAAFTQHAQLLAHYPTDATALALVAYLLNVAGDAPSAQAHYEEALRLAPHHRLAHRGLALMYAAQNNPVAAARHTALGASGQILYPRQFRGVGAGIGVILCLSNTEPGCGLPAYRMLDESRFAVSEFIVEEATAGFCLPKHALIFNGIADADAAAAALQKLEPYLTQSPQPVINAPRLIAQTGRAAIAARLRNKPDVVCPRMLEIPRAAASGDAIYERVEAAGLTTPFLLRIPRYQAGKFFYRIDDKSSLTQVLADLPPGDLLAIEYIDTRSDTGFYEKFRVMSIDGALYPVHAASSTAWKVHYFSSAMASDAHLRAREAYFLNDPQAAIGARAWNALRAITRALPLDYFGVDFAIDDCGRVILFEANAAMVVAKPGAQAHWDYRRPAYAAALAAARRMLEARVSAAN